MQFERAAKTDFANIKKIYFEAFPKSERKPFGMIKRAYAKGRYDVFVLRADAGTLRGFAVTFSSGDIVLVDYLAVSSESRGTGAGSALLTHLADAYAGKRLMLLIEFLDPYAENIEQRMKRKKFYLKNAYKETGITLAGAFGDMEVLGFGGKIHAQECLLVQKQDLGSLLMRLSRIRIKAVV